MTGAPGPTRDLTGTNRLLPLPVAPLHQHLVRASAAMTVRIPAPGQVRQSAARQDFRFLSGWGQLARSDRFARSFPPHRRYCRQAGLFVKLSSPAYLSGKRVEAARCLARTTKSRARRNTRPALASGNPDPDQETGQIGFAG